MADMVRFGLKNVHYSVYDQTEAQYGTPVAVSGAVQLTTSPEGDSSTFFADDRAYFTTETNSGYSGTVEVAAVNEQFLTDVLANKKDTTTKLVYESTDAKPPQVALMFEIDGNVEKQRCIFYNVTFSRIDTEANTRSDTTDPDTVTLNFTAIGRQFTISTATENVVKAQCTDSEETHDAFDKFFTKVVIPGQALAGE